jgi:hypothetical protein
MTQSSGIIRVKQADGTYKTIIPQTTTDAVTNEQGKTITQILAEDVAEKEHVHNYSSDVPSTVAVGGIEKGFTTDGLSVEDLIFKLLHPYVKPTINYSCSPNGGVYEIGSSVASIKITATGVRQSDIIQQVRIYKDGAVVHTVNHNASGNCTATYEDTNLTANAVYKADVYDGKNTVVSSSTNFTFVRPAYVGVLPADISEGITAEMIASLTKKVMSPAMISNSFTLTDSRMCIATPPGWTIKSIVDPNGFDITASFASQTVEVTCLDGSVISYTFYISDVTSQSGFTVKFNK